MAKLAKEGATTFLQTEKGLEEGARKMWETGCMWNETKLMQVNKFSCLKIIFLILILILYF